MKEVNFEFEDITAKMSAGTQALLENIIPQTVREYLEERPCGKDFKSKTVRFLKKAVLRIAWKFIHKYRIHFITVMFFQHYGLPGSGLSYNFYTMINNWKYEIYLHCASKAVYLGFAVKESELENGYRNLSDLIELKLGPDVVRGSLSGAMQMKLYRLPEDVEQRYVLLAYIHIDRGFSELVHELIRTPEGRKSLDRFHIIREGEMPREIA